MLEGQHSLEGKYAEVQRKFLTKHRTATTSRHLTLKDPPLEVHCLEGGEGEPVLLLHGGGGFAASWGPLLAALKDHYSIYAPDRPGCGLTESFNYRGVDFREHAVRFVTSVLDELGLEKASLIGNSMGGYWSLVFALAHPERVRKIVLIGAPAGIDRKLPALIKLLGTPGINRFLSATFLKPSPKNTRTMFEKILLARDDRIAPELIDCAYLASILPGAQRSGLTLLEAVATLTGFNRRYYIREELKNVPHPTLFIWGDKDAFAPPASGEQVCRPMPNARIEIVPNAGHLPWLDEPDLCARHVLDFLRSD